MADLSRVEQFISTVNELEVQQMANVRTKEKLLADAEELVRKAELKQEELDVVTNAISILRIVSDNSVKESYEYITESVNAALSRIFTESTRRIRLQE